MLGAVQLAVCRCRNPLVALAIGIFVLAVPTVASADLIYVVRGVDDPLKSNILKHVDTLQLGPKARLADRDFNRVLASAVSNARVALRPYGYYAAEVQGKISRNAAGDPVLELDVRPGPPMIVESIALDVVGPGSRESNLRAWKRNWPLGEGQVLDQVVWEGQKQRALELSSQRGYLAAKYSEHRLELDLERKRANAALTLDTGPRFVIGQIDFGDHGLKPGILEHIPRFESGDPYSRELLDDFRSDLWQTGYFTDIEVVEVRRPEQEPPAVDLVLRTETRYKNSYTGALGFGTDTGFRLQANWSRHPMSSNGDRLDLGIGWQEYDDEVALRATYRLPRRERNREFWIVDTTLRKENMDLEFKLDPEDEGFINYATGDIDERHIRFGRLKIRNRKSGEAQLFSTPFVQYINSVRRFQPVVIPTTPYDDEGLERLLRGIDNAFSLGIELNLVSVVGRGWETSGHRERAWVFHSDKAFGSEVEFTQAYLSSQRMYLRGDRWKFLLRAELGYTDAIVDNIQIDLAGQPLELSRTRLPNFYRFKAGGSNSVRGYGFESLSNNDIGSNNIMTASAEVEFRLLEKWSLAAFVDVGNAFNDWSDPALKTGIGMGVRWYSIAGPIRVDIAQAQDYNGKPWRLHFTIGVPLL